MKKKIANRLEWLFLITFLVLFIILLTSCRSKETTIKSNTEIKANVSQNTANSVDTQTEVHITENIKESQSKESQSNQIKDVSITHITVKYDTDKPIDPTTGKHPVKEETLTTINKQSKEESKQSEQNNKEKTSTKTTQQRVQQLVKSNTQSSLHYTTKNEKKEKYGLSTTHKVLIAFGCIGIGVLFFRVYKWIRK